MAKNLGNFFKYEYLQFTIYCPDLRRAKENGVSIAATVGEKSQGPFMRGLQYRSVRFLDVRGLLCLRITWYGV